MFNFFSKVFIKGEGGQGSKVQVVPILIEFFLMNSTVFVSSKNSKYFLRYRVKMPGENDHFQTQIGLKSM